MIFLISRRYRTIAPGACRQLPRPSGKETLIEQRALTEQRTLVEQKVISKQQAISEQSVPEYGNQSTP